MQGRQAETLAALMEKMEGRCLYAGQSRIAFQATRTLQPTPYTE